jgi:hypothetical protein
MKEVEVECGGYGEKGAAYLMQVKLEKKTFLALKVLRQFPLVPLL